MKKESKWAVGERRTAKNFTTSKAKKQRYQLRSDNLELVTILECISAAGDVVPPSFCLQNGGIPDLQKLDNEEWGSIYLVLKYHLEEGSMLVDQMS